MTYDVCNRIFSDLFRYVCGFEGSETGGKDFGEDPNIFDSMG